MGEIRTMMLWPAVALLGFLVLTAVVIAMGAQTTARYEREQRDGLSAGGLRPASGRQTAAEPVGALST
jgi:hypothetical protein